MENASKEIYLLKLFREKSFCFPSKFYIYIILILTISIGYTYLFSGCYWIALGLIRNFGLTDHLSKPIGSDFIGFYSAAKLALLGNPAKTYSILSMHEIEKSVIGLDVGSWAWNYPPSFLLFLIPLSLLPYIIAFPVWILSTLILNITLIRRIIYHHITPIIFLAFIPTVNNLFYGQNGFLSTIIIGYGLLLMDNRPFLSGIILGLISYKPQLSIFVPLAIISGRYWLTLFGFISSSLGLILLSIFFFGFETWLAFINNLTFSSSIMNMPQFWHKMVSIYAMMQNIGAGKNLSIIIQALSSILAISSVVWIWSKKTPVALRGTILIISTLLGTPYSFEYDLVLLSLPFAWLFNNISIYKSKLAVGALIFSWLGTVFFPFFNATKNFSPINLILILIVSIYCTIQYRFKKYVPIN